MTKKKPATNPASPPTNSMPTISLCMIAKNEEALLASCLQSVRPILSEIIFVDTGSTDRTVQIAQSYVAKIIHEPWREDFAAARNISLEHATSDWILVLDADEVIAESDLPGLQALTKDRRVCSEFLQRHYSNDYRLSNYTPVSGEFPKLEAGHAGLS